MTSPPQQGLTAGRVCEVLDWEIQFLTIARNRFCPRTQVLASGADQRPAQPNKFAAQDARPAQSGPLGAEDKAWEVDCPPPAKTAGVQFDGWDADCAPPAKSDSLGKIVWAADCPPPARPEAVDPCEALSACIHSLTELRTAFEAMPPDRVLG